MCAGKNYTTITIACPRLSLSEERRQIESALALASWFFFFSVFLLMPHYFLDRPHHISERQQQAFKFWDKFDKLEVTHLSKWQKENSPPSETSHASQALLLPLLTPPTQARPQSTVSKCAGFAREVDVKV